jgi:HlyD family secretion protein
VARQTGVLKVPNAALRFKPVTTEAQRPAAATRGTSTGRPRPKVWIQKTPGGRPTPVPVKLGITDGSSTELKEAEGLQAGQEVIVGLAEAGKPAQATVNPFAPRMPGGGRPR